VATIEESTLIKGVYHAFLTSHGDARGRFVETYRRQWFPGSKEMVQGNRSESQAGVLRGLHYHFKQADYWYVIKGRVFVALFDARKGSPTYGTSEGFVLGEDDDPRVRDHGVYIPPGVAHGFLTLTDCLLTYLVEAYYDNSDELGILWNDPALKIDWPNRSPILSDRDKKNLPLAEMKPEVTPYWRG
jgi:dTDP-4-dehydrorhamnose 3,5-epimerase